MPERQESREIGDALRIESSTLPPKDAKILKGMLGKYVGIMEAEFGQYIPENRRQYARNAADNTLVTDDLVLFTNLWDKDRRPRDFLSLQQDIIDSDTVGGSHLRTDGPPVNLIKDVYHELSSMPEEERKKLLEGWGENPEENWNVVRMLFVSAHELAHAYHDPNLPKYIAEFFAESMSDYLVEKLTGWRFRDETLRFFEDLRGRFGNNLFRVMFGSNRNPIARYRVLKAIDIEKVRNLLPDQDL